MQFRRLTKAERIIIETRLKAQIGNKSAQSQCTHPSVAAFADVTSGLDSQTEACLDYGPMSRPLHMADESLSPSRIPETVRKTLSGIGPDVRLRRVVIGASGGADSTALALLAHRLLVPQGVELILAHVDHTLPEAETPEDSDFTRALAKRLGAPFIERRVQVREAMARTGESLEMAARRLRHNALRDIAKEVGAEAIALGHNADDQVETMLLRLARGTGPRGLGGMAVWQPASEGGPGLLRPLLNCPREDIREWLRSEGESWREDPTNAADDVLRNRLRHHVLPALYEVLGDGARQGFLNTAALLRDEESRWLGPLVEAELERCRLAGKAALDTDRLRSLSPPLLRRVLLREAQQAGLPLSFQTQTLLENLAEFATRPDSGSATLDIGAGFRATRVYGSFSIAPSEAEEAEGQTPQLWGQTPKSEGQAPVFQIAPPESKGQTSKLEGQTPVSGVLPVGSRLCIEAATGYKLTGRTGILDRPQTAYLSSSAISDPAALFVRRILPGDRLQPVGAEGASKISDILVNRKLPRERRREVEVVCAGERVVWLPGHSVDAAFAVESPTAPSWKCMLLSSENS